MTKLPNPALQTEALYSKSQVYISKGLRAKLANDLEEYQLWASLALELLAKSSLSRVHPALVADPTHYQSLFAACGISVSPEIKTITAKTLFLRLSHISKSFDLRVREFCEQLALRRNSEIHSGESPFSGMKAEAWEMKYWHAIEVILEMQKRELDEWLGAEDSKAPKEILQNAERAVQMAVQTRIDHKREDFEKLHKNKVKREELIEQSKSIRYWDHWKKFEYSVDGYESSKCPSCSAFGILGGVLWHEEVSDEYDEDDPFTEYVEKTFSTEEFLCPTCGLHLAGTRELYVTDLPEEFCQTEEREREFEPEYGND
ncbi:hypothetical protein LJ739_10740 [Aestuariibacter halophilus]|uniref:Apea-like HEPN domain-containing protein n=1 Tax=Fluctibacter halophilus TaxID=226011 RepID=A0ABS8G860_9ALTE|nr:hypothetical protein [Aestuariibacter halophilus]MCC2616718.1 hypothetical protein [Aestuariibacter halophilus]